MKKTPIYEMLNGKHLRDDKTKKAGNLSNLVARKCLPIEAALKLNHQSRQTSLL